MSFVSDCIDLSSLFVSLKLLLQELGVAGWAGWRLVGKWTHKQTVLMEWWWVRYTGVNSYMVR